MKIYTPISKTLISASLLFTLSACQMFEPDVQTKDFENEIPKEFLNSSDKELYVDNNWWKEFGDKQLNKLVEEALQNSPAIGEIFARLKKVEAQTKIVKTQLLPSLDASAKAGVGENFGTSNSQGFEAYSVSLSAGYELDLWGRVNAQIQSAENTLEVAKMDTQTAVSTLISNVVITWVQIQTQMRYREVLKEQLTINEQILNSMQYRYVYGKSDSILDVFQQRQTVNSAQTAIPLSEQKENAYRTKLCLLLGKPANTQLDIKPIDIPELRTLPSNGLPTQILESRPDIIASKNKLLSNAWLLSSARANLLPKIALSSSVPVISLSSNKFKNLFDIWTVQVSGIISQPIFDGGQRIYQIDAQQAATLESFNAYKSTILTALKEVQDSISNESTQTLYIESLLNSYKDSKSMLAESQNRYQQGQEDYLNVVAAIATKQSLELQLITAKSNRLLYRVALYTSLGGAWIPNVTSPLKDINDKIFENANSAPLKAEILGQY